MATIIELSVNGTSRPVDATPDQQLLGVLREDLGLTGCKIGCGEGECGACTVLVDDHVTRSCITTLEAVNGCQIRTIEGLAMDGVLHPLQQAFLDHDALQCGYCTPGMIMTGLGLLARCPDPDEQTIIEAMQGNICRCGTYPRIVRAIQQAATVLRATQSAGGAQ